MRPFRIFGQVVSTCYVLPALTVMLLLGLFTFVLFATVSHYRPPVTLHSIWFEQRSFSAEDVKAGKAEFTLKKSGTWHRLCPVDAEQVFVEEHGSIRFTGETHSVDVPPSFERMAAKPRPKPDVIPKVLATSPGWWRLQLTNLNGACWPWERLWPIAPTQPVEAWFEIRP